MNASPIKQAVATLGGQTAMARAIGVSQGLVWQWCENRARIPAERCIAIEQATAGVVTRSDLRPDLWPPSEQHGPSKRAA